MFVFKQQNSAADLSMLVLESLEKSEDKVDDDTLGEFYCVCWVTPLCCSFVNVSGVAAVLYVVRWMRCGLMALAQYDNYYHKRD